MEIIEIIGILVQVIIIGLCWLSGFALLINGLGECFNFMGDRPWSIWDAVLGGIMVGLAIALFYLPNYSGVL